MNLMFFLLVCAMDTCYISASYEYFVGRHSVADCLVYLDDIIVLGQSFSELLHNLAKIFQRLRRLDTLQKDCFVL